MPATGSTCKHQCNQTPSCRQNLCFKPFKVPRSYPKTSATCFGLDSYPKKHAAPSALSWQLLALSAECQYCQTRIHAKNTQMLMPASDCPSPQHTCSLEVSSYSFMNNCFAVSKVPHHMGDCMNACSKQDPAHAPLARSLKRDASAPNDK